MEEQRRRQGAITDTGRDGRKCLGNDSDLRADDLDEWKKEDKDPTRVSADGTSPCLQWTSDALAALALHGYLRPDPTSREADKEGVTWRDAVRLRVVSKAIRSVVDTEDGFWREQYKLLTQDKLYDPPHLVALEERGAYRMAFRLGLQEPKRTNIPATELHRVSFFSKLSASYESEAVRAERCPWWRYDHPRQHRFSRDGTLIALTHDPTQPGRRVRSEVGHWTFAFVPVAPNDFFVCIIPLGTNYHQLWRVQWHEQSWNILIVGAGAFTVSCQIPLRSSQTGFSEECERGEVLIEESTLMTQADKEMLLDAGVAMSNAATGEPTLSVHDVPTVRDSSEYPDEEEAAD
jgi:hypothetical protein